MKAAAMVQEYHAYALNGFSIQIIPETADGFGVSPKIETGPWDEQPLSAAG